MSFFFHSLFVLLAATLQLAASNLTLTGIALHPLAVLTVVCVWRDAQSAVAFRLLPAALLVDFFQPSPIPVTVLVVLMVWLIASLVQRHWLTNHSLASLGGIAVLSTLTRLGTTWLVIAVGGVAGLSSVHFGATWTWRENLLRFFVESAITIAIGAGWRFFQRSLRRTFIYGTR